MIVADLAFTKELTIKSGIWVRHLYTVLAHWWQKCKRTNLILQKFKRLRGSRGGEGEGKVCLISKLMDALYLTAILITVKYNFIRGVKHLKEVLSNLFLKNKLFIILIKLKLTHL